MFKRNNHRPPGIVDVDLLYTVIRHITFGQALNTLIFTFLYNSIKLLIQNRKC